MAMLPQVSEVIRVAMLLQVSEVIRVAMLLQVSEVIRVAICCLKYQRLYGWVCCRHVSEVILVAMLPQVSEVIRVAITYLRPPFRKTNSQLPEVMLVAKSHVTTFWQIHLSSTRGYSGGYIICDHPLARPVVNNY